MIVNYIFLVSLRKKYYQQRRKPREEQMGEYFERLKGPIQQHLKQLVKTAGLENTEENIEMLAQAWIEKESCFQQKLDENNMEVVELLEKSSEKGALVLTYSGSLLNIGPVIDGSRKVEYASIGLRKDVPENASDDESELDSDVKAGGAVSFVKGPIKKSSPIYKVAVVREEMAPEEEEELLDDVTQVLCEDFVEVNKTIIL
jgi:hypothetical protein